MADTPTVSGYLLNQMTTLLRELGENPEPILAAAGLDESALAEADTRVPVDLAWYCWEQAYTLCNEAQLGLTIAAQVGEGYPTLRFSLRNAGTLGNAFGRWARFYGLISDHGTQTLIRNSNGACMRCTRNTGSATPVVIEDWMVGQWLTLGRHLVGVDWTPTSVCLEHAVVGEASQYEKWFGAPVQFESEQSEMAIPDSALTLPIRGSDLSLSVVLDRHIEDILAKRSDQSGFTGRARAAMAKELEGGDPSAAAIAAKLNVSERTLLRRLRDEGTTPTDLLRQLRFDFARQYLRDQDISLTEVAYLLGYSEVSAFHRAFKRWSGQTPAEFRAQIYQA